MLKAQQRLIDSTVNMTIGNHSVKHRGVTLVSIITMQLVYAKWTILIE